MKKTETKIDSRNRSENRDESQMVDKKEEKAAQAQERRG